MMKLFERLDKEAEEKLNPFTLIQELAQETGKSLAFIASVIKRGIYIRDSFTPLECYGYDSNNGFYPYHQGNYDFLDSIINGNKITGDHPFSCPPWGEPEKLYFKKREVSFFLVCNDVPLPPCIAGKSLAKTQEEIFYSSFDQSVPLMSEEESEEYNIYFDSFDSYEPDIFQGESGSQDEIKRLNAENEALKAEVKSLTERLAQNEQPAPFKAEEDPTLRLNSFVKNDLLKLAIETRRNYWGSYEHGDDKPKAEAIITELRTEFEIKQSIAKYIERVACPIDRN